MFRFLCRCHGPLKPYRRFISSTRPYLAEAHPAASNIIHELENDGARILQAVKKRVKVRDELLANMSEDMSSPEDIARARQLKELEPLHEAWSNWTHARQ